ncbi:MAG: hypothetical protein ABJ327_01300 [Litoreibacter sp.]
MKIVGKKPTSFALRLVVLMLVASGLMRLGTVGVAIARDTNSEDIVQEEFHGDCGPDEDVAGLYELISERTKQLDDQELALLMRQKDLEAAEILIQRNLVQLEASEAQLAATIDSVDGASEDDLSQLTSVYVAMKPQTAAALFDQMTPKFAAGFLGRMPPKSAGEIMSNLPPEAAYAISVVLAGRNANVPTE